MKVETLPMAGTDLLKRIRTHQALYEDFRIAANAWEKINKDDFSENHPAVKWLENIGPRKADNVKAALTSKITPWLDDLEALSEIMADLISPLADQIKGKSLMVIPCGDLALLPLQAAGYRPRLERRLRRILRSSSLGWLAGRIKQRPWLSQFCGLSAPRRVLLERLALNFVPNAAILLHNRAEEKERRFICRWDEEFKNESDKVVEITNGYGKAGEHKSYNEQIKSGEILENLTLSSIFEYIGHAIADLFDPLNRSGLRLSNETLLSIREFLVRKFPGLRYIGLTACEAARASPNLAAEVINLPSILLHALIKGVTAHSWAVLSGHAVTMARDFHLLWAVEPNADPAELLRRVQISYRQQAVLPDPKSKINCQFVISEPDPDKDQKAKVSNVPRLGDSPVLLVPSKHPYAWGSSQFWGW